MSFLPRLGMDPLRPDGTAASLISLTAPFKAALDAWSFVDAETGNAGKEENLKLKARLDHQRCDFLVWAERFGFFSQQGYNKALDEQSRGWRVGRLLEGICFLLDTDELEHEYGLEVCSTGNPSAASVQIFEGRYIHLQTVLGRLRRPLVDYGELDNFVWHKTKWHISDDGMLQKLIDRVTSLVCDLDGLTRDIATARTAEDIAYEAIEWFSGSQLEFIKRNSRGHETTVSRVAVKRYLSLCMELHALIWDGSEATDDEDGKPTIKKADLANREVCRRLLSNVSSLGLEEAGAPTCRVVKELRSWLDDNPNGWFTMAPVSESSVDMILGTILGPVGTPYEKGIFHVCIAPTEKYPFEPARVWFVTKIVHPNIDPKGNVFLDILQPDRWSPTYHMANLLVSIASLLDQPNYDDGGDWVPRLTSNDEPDGDQAEEWTRMYATGRIIYPGMREDGFCTVNESVPPGLKSSWDGEPWEWGP